MCGICGFARHDPGAAPEPERLGAMVATLEHRGPDDEGLEEREGVGLGFRRLSIIDLEGGHQPIWNEEGTVAVTCNGEIYNFRELRQELETGGHRFETSSDIECLVHLYEETGAAMLERLVGMFALAVADFREPGRPRILLARDRLGIKPLYWCATEDGLYWASEPKAVLASGCLSRRMRGEALVDYLVQGFCSGPLTAWEGLSRLEAGQRLLWSPGDRRPRPERYWDLPLDGPRGSASSEEILAGIDRAVAERLVADVPLGAFLSGGIDSTAVVSAMAAASGEAVQACSVGFEERSHDELEQARRSAARIGLVHHTEVLRPDPAAAIEVLPWFFDEPLADSSTVPTWLVSRMAREHVTVALSGDGGDEVFAGYRRYVFDVAEQRVRRAAGAARPLFAAAGAAWPRMAWAPRWLRAKSVLQNLGREPGRAYYASLTQVGLEEARAVLAPELRDALAQHDPFLAFEEHYRRPRDADSLYRAQYADFKTWLPERILTKTDRASMAVSLEVRVPLLDHRFVEAFVHLPMGDKVSGGRGKHALREALRPRLPAEVLDGRKRGFETPLRAWIQGPLAGAVGEAIEEIPSEVFDRDALRRRLEGHRSGLQDHSQLLWSLLVWEHWRRRHGMAGIAT